MAVAEEQYLCFHSQNQVTLLWVLLLRRPIQKSLLACCCPILRAGVGGKPQVASLRKMNRSQAPSCVIRVIVHLVVITVYAGIEPTLLHRRAFMSWPDSALPFAEGTERSLACAGSRSHRL